MIMFLVVLMLRNVQSKVTMPQNLICGLARRPSCNQTATKTPCTHVTLQTSSNDSSNLPNKAMYFEGVYLNLKRICSPVRTRRVITDVCTELSNLEEIFSWLGYGFRFEWWAFLDWYQFQLSHCDLETALFLSLQFWESVKEDCIYPTHKPG